VFKEFELLKAQQPIDWDEEQQLHRTFIDTIQLMQNEKTIDQINHTTDFDTS
jgi:hypothetical protein